MGDVGYLIVVPGFFFGDCYYNTMPPQLRENWLPNHPPGLYLRKEVASRYLLTTSGRKNGLGSWKKDKPKCKPKSSNCKPKSNKCKPKPNDMHNWKLKWLKS